MCLQYLSLCFLKTALQAGTVLVSMEARIFFRSPLFCPSSLFFLCQTTVVGTRVSVVHVQCCWVTVR